MPAIDNNACTTGEAAALPAGLHFARRANPAPYASHSVAASAERVISVVGTAMTRRVDLSVTHVHGQATFTFSAADARAIAAELLACADTIAHTGGLEP